MKKAFIILGSFLLMLGVVSLVAPKAEATTICQIFPWLPQCNPNPTPSPSPSPTLSPSPSPTPSVEPSPTPSEEPRVSPTPSPEVCVGTGANGQPCGWSPSYNPPEYKPAVCTVSLPSKPSFTYQRDQIDPTIVHVWWPQEDDTNTTGWSLSWGYDKDNLPYGSGNKLPKEARSFDIGNLPPTSIVWIELARWNGNECVVYSDRLDP